MLNVGAPFVLGVNYWPRSRAMDMWKGALGTDEIRADFSTMKHFGLSLVRVFLLWEDFQPTATEVASVDKLLKVADLAAAEGLKLDVTFFTGHMSGPNWIPSWMLLRDEPLPAGVMQVISGGETLRCGYRNPYTDEWVQEAEERLIAAVVTALHGHPALGLWNLANEPDLVAIPSEKEAVAWVKRMVGCIRRLDTTTPVTCGLHAPSLREDVGFRVTLFRDCDLFPVIHGYPMYATGWAQSPLDESFVPGLCGLTTLLCGKATLAEEFGACTVQGESRVMEFMSYGAVRRQFMAGEDDFANHLRKVLASLHLLGATGAVLWCWADYSEELYNQPPLVQSVHERFFGIVRSDGSLKPHAAVIREFAEMRPLIQRGSQKTIDSDSYYSEVTARSQIEIQRFRK